MAGYRCALCGDEPATGVHDDLAHVDRALEEARDVDRFLSELRYPLCDECHQILRERCREVSAARSLADETAAMAPLVEHAKRLNMQTVRDASDIWRHD